MAANFSKASHSTRVRGLKFFERLVIVFVFLSHSTRVRGLKSPRVVYLYQRNLVALYTSAWIEIRSCPPMPDWTARRTLHECVDWNTICQCDICIRECRTLHECVDWNNQIEIFVTRKECRTLHECVDWNNIATDKDDPDACRTLHECVDWNMALCTEHHKEQHKSHSTRVRGLKFHPKQ